ncbi:MAG: hypothetical protein HC924_06865 [Synechococcaceae cyanobacterium SM2_3_2]|nr:hypothetical protein [Synechococcaceae cyanobacterium SM2_3_2]
MSDSPSIQAQVDRLQEQVRDLHVAIERMPEQIASVLLSAQEIGSGAGIPVIQPVAAAVDGHYAAENSGAESEETYSFLLKEESPASSQRQMGHHISPEAQVQRLTAQLTAAYNRIAALEEQLLAQRIR